MESKGLVGYLSKKEFFLAEGFRNFSGKFLKEKKFEVISAHDLGAKGLNDEQQLKIAINHRSLLITNNKRDFLEESKANQEEHFGIIIITHQHKTISGLYNLAKMVFDQYLNWYTAEEFRNFVIYL